MNEWMKCVKVFIFIETPSSRGPRKVTEINLEEAKDLTILDIFTFIANSG